MSCEPVVSLHKLGKCYQIYEQPRDRLFQMLLRKRYYREFWAVRNVSLKINRGEVLGIIGRNGAGKSTLLQMICGVLNPTEGSIAVNGRVAALLELGAGFNPEFTGRENIYLSAAVMGLPRAVIDERYDEIVEFSGIGDFIEQPLKTYSSGMYVRLAFSVATSIDPDILIVDEALSVGDGEFSRKSFDRIIALKDRGATVLFCSHSLYQVEAFCDHVLWLDRGECKCLGDPTTVVSSYKSFLLKNEKELVSDTEVVDDSLNEEPTCHNISGQGYFVNIETAMDGVVCHNLKGTSGKSNLSVGIDFYLDPTLPDPVVGLNIDYEAAVAMTSVVSRTDGVEIVRDESGYGFAEIILPQLALRKGEYFISVYLGCENAVHIYDQAVRAASFTMVDDYPEPGLVSLPHQWKVLAGNKPKGDDSFIALPWGGRIKTDLLDSLGLRSNDGSFEQQETDLCRLLVKPGDRVLDVGANIGYYTLLFCSLVTSSGVVTAIEPDRENYLLLQHNVAENNFNSIVDAYQIALGSSVSTSKLFRSMESNGHHRLYASVCCSDKFTEVCVDTGDNLNLGPLDFVKIDVEGYEPEAIKGLSATIAMSPNFKMLCEFSPLSIWESGGSPIEFLTQMKTLGLHLLTLESELWVETPFSKLLDELEKIPEKSIIELITNFEFNRSQYFIQEQVEVFLAEHNYRRPFLENIVLVASGAWSSVVADLDILPIESKTY
jgi:lipopolysaccharide transport system ATP-binding protein